MGKMVAEDYLVVFVFFDKFSNGREILLNVRHQL